MSLLIAVAPSVRAAVKWLVGTTRRRVAIALVAFAALAVMGQVDAMLREMHLPGTRSAGVTDIDSATTTPRDVVQILSSWDAWDAEQASVGSYGPTGHVIGGWLLVDTLLFAPSLALIIAGVARERRDAARVRAQAMAFASIPAALMGQPVTIEPRRLRATVALTQILDLAWRLAFIYLAFDWLENVLTWWAVGSRSLAPPVASLVQGASIAKVGALVFAIVPILLSYGAFPGPAAASLRTTAKTIVALRAQIVGALGAVALLLYLPGNVRPQLSDLIRSWNAQRATTAIAASVLLAGVVLITGRGTVARRAESVTATDYGVVRLSVQSLVAGILIVLGVSIGDDIPGVHSGTLPIAFGILLGIWVLLALPIALWELGPTRKCAGCRVGAVPFLAFLPPYALLLAWLRAQVTFGDWWPKSGVGVVAVLALCGLWYALYHGSIGSKWVVAVVAGSAALVLYGAVHPRWLDQLRGVSYRAGSVALALAALALVVAVLTLCSILLRQPPRGALAFVGVRSFPLLSTIVALLIVTSMLDTAPNFHRARVLDLEPKLERTSSRQPFTVTQAFGRWNLPKEANAPDKKQWRPLLVVAAAGGGARAAYWTLLALDCLFDSHPTPLEKSEPLPACAGSTVDESSFFAGSGISGGSVGLAMFSALRHGPDAVTHIDPDRIFGSSYVDAVFANLVAVDAPNALLRAPGWTDRAGALEDAWKQDVPQLAHRLFADRPDATSGNNWQPLLLLNSAAVEDGCRVSVSTLSLTHEASAVDAIGATGSTGSASTTSTTVEPADLAPGLPREPVGPCRELRTADLPSARREDSVIASTRDMRDILCRDQDFDLATAALLSARFPFVSPSGAVPFCSDKKRFTYLVDGGLVDSSAASTADALLRDLVPKIRAQNEAKDRAGPCVQPVVVQLDNGYDDVPTADRPSRPKELLAPLTGVLAATSSRAAEARQSLAGLGSRLAELAGCASTVPDLPTYVRVVPHTHPGIQAPLGWSLSKDARNDMKREFRSDRNQCSLLVLRHWLSNTSNGHGCIAGTVRYAPDTTRPSENAVGVQKQSVVCPDNAAWSCKSVKTGAYGEYIVPTDNAIMRAPGLHVGGAGCAVVHGNQTLARACDFQVASPAPDPPRPSWNWERWLIVGLAVIVVAALSVVGGLLGHKRVLVVGPS